MFRCTKELKGLAIDYDSFEDIPFDKWKEISEIVNCVFITSKPESKKDLEENISDVKILRFDEFQKILSPNIETHSKVLQTLKLETTEMAYVSTNYSFIKNAGSFLIAAIWVSKNVDYDDTKRMPDIVIENIDRLIEALKKHVAGFFGEVTLFPEPNRPGSFLRVKFNVDDKMIYMYVIGRYFGNKHYMSQLHPYSSAIYLNKVEGKTYTNVFNDTFGEIYFTVFSILYKQQKIDGVCSVPIKPNKGNRFAKPIDIICKNINIKNLNQNFYCIKDYLDQKGLNAEEREKNIKGVFKYNGDLTGKTVVLLDDIVTTGATLRECVRVLRKAGAKEVIAVVMAINQMETSYWSTDLPKVRCPVCGNKMLLLVNGKGKFFYSCNNCYRNKRKNKSLDFSIGWDNLLKEENEKITEAMKKHNKDKLINDDLDFD